ncbi:MAG: hypothetical protein LAO30_25365 [Acidobacteriia bacterium]|nr:hypothetical protein [Terriglobia bacterium]
MPKSFMLLLMVAVALSSTAVFAQEQKPKSNNEKHTLRLETDSGRYGVGSDKLDPKQLGVAIYPGAKVEENDNDGKGASLSLDWGRDSARLYVQKYVTSDSADQVLSFYRKHLSKFGAVLECRDGKPLAAVASELKCEDGKDEKGTELKAGTENKQHIIGVTPKDGGTEFGVLYLEKTKRGEL